MIHIAQAATYRILVEETIDPIWLESLGGLEVTEQRQPDGRNVTQLEGRLVDQSALQGVIDTLFMLGMRLILVERLPADSTRSGGYWQHPEMAMNYGKEQLTAATQHLRPERGNLASDLIAGLTFAVVNVPQAMGHALLAAVNPVYGIYTLMVAVPIGALFTGSVFMNVSTTSALSVAAGAGLVGVPASQRMEALAVLVFLVGVIQLLAGLFRFGFILRFVSNAVMTGFLNGVAVLIILGQLDDLTGYDSPFRNSLIRAVDLMLNPTQIVIPTTIIGVFTLVLIVLLLATKLRRFAFIIAIVTSTFLLVILSSPQLPTAELFGKVANRRRYRHDPKITAAPGIAESVFSRFDAATRAFARDYRPDPGRRGKPGNPEPRRKVPQCFARLFRPGCSEPGYELCGWSSGRRVDFRNGADPGCGREIALDEYFRRSIRGIDRAAVRAIGQTGGDAIAGSAAHRRWFPGIAH